MARRGRASEHICDPSRLSHVHGHGHIQCGRTSPGSRVLLEIAAQMTAAPSEWQLDR